MFGSEHAGSAWQSHDRFDSNRYSGAGEEGIEAFLETRLVFIRQRSIWVVHRNRRILLAARGRGGSLGTVDRTPFVL